MKEPWKLDTNNKYSEVIKSIMGLATASLLLPVFLARNILGIKAETSLTKIFSWPIYTAWVFLFITLFFCIFYQYLSAKWVRLAWGKPAGMLWAKNTQEKTIELLMELCLWGCVLTFFLGLVFTISYFVGY